MVQGRQLVVLVWPCGPALLDVPLRDEQELNAGPLADTSPHVQVCIAQLALRTYAVPVTCLPCFQVEDNTM